MSKGVREDELLILRRIAKAGLVRRPAFPWTLFRPLVRWSQ